MLGKDGPLEISMIKCDMPSFYTFTMSQVLIISGGEKVLENPTPLSSVTENDNCQYGFHSFDRKIYRISGLIQDCSISIVDALEILLHEVSHWYKL